MSRAILTGGGPVHASALRWAGETDQTEPTTAVQSTPVPSKGLEPAVSGSVFTALRFGALLLLLIAIAFPDVFSGSHTFFYRDFGLFGYPLACYHRAMFWRGELPFWNPFNDCGLPFLAQWNTLTLYPGSLIYLLLPLPWSLSVFSLAHLWLAGMGMYLLAQRWTRSTLAGAIAGTAYALNGLMLHAVMWPNNIAALAWLPWVILLAERGWTEGKKWVFIAAAAAAMQLLAGAPEVIALTWLTLGFLCGTQCLSNRSSGLRLSVRFVVIGLCAAALSAPQLLPFLELLHASHRTSRFGGNSWSMPLWGWANFFVPLWGCSKSVLGVYSQDAQQWTSSYYVSLGALALGLSALLKRKSRRVWVLAILGIAGLVLALGDHGLVYPALKRLAPQLGFTRYPIKYVMLPIVVIPLLAAFGTQSLTRQLATAQTIPRWTGIVRLGAAWLAVSLVISTLLWSAAHHPLPGEQVRVTLQSGASRFGFLTLSLAALVALGWARQPRVDRLLELSCVVLIGLDAMTHAPRQNPTLPIAALKPAAMDLPGMPKLGEGRALITPRVQGFFSYAATPDRLAYHLGHQHALLGNLNLVQSIQKVNGFYSLYLQDTAQVEALLASGSNPTPPALLDFLGVTQVSSETSWFEWNQRTSALPLITAGQEPIFADGPTALAGLTNMTFAPAQMVYLPDSARSLISVRHPTTARVVNSDFQPNYIQTVVQAEEPSLLVIAQSHARGWRAQIDGRLSTLWPANFAFQALEVPAGTHTVRLEYHDPWFGWGMGISAITVAIILGGLVLGRQKPVLDGMCNRPRQTGSHV